MLDEVSPRLQDGTSFDDLIDVDMHEVSLRHCVTMKSINSKWNAFYDDPGYRKISGERRDLLRRLDEAKW
ncbi:hypothetical protein [Novosphingobium sp. BL-52-GroH]|uniref:hypothetical protein n=1 Tax=Novosphingobium sp. BL-52-GroH TaxID=3349877 RepID=UPI00384ED9E0